MLKRLILAFFLVCSPLGLAACQTAAVEAVQPRTAREAYALAEISFVGVVTVAQSMHANGVLSTEDARSEVLPVLEEAQAGLRLARQLIAAGDEAGAGRLIESIRAALNVLAIELSRRQQLAPVGSPV